MKYKIYLIIALMLSPFAAFGQLQVSASFDAIFPTDAINWKSGFGGTVGVGSELNQNVHLYGNFSYYTLTANTTASDGSVMNISALTKIVLTNRKFYPFVGLRLGVTTWSFDLKIGQDESEAAALTGLVAGIGYSASDNFSIELNTENTFILRRINSNNAMDNPAIPQGYPSVSLRGVVTF